MADRVRFLRLLKHAPSPTQTQVADLLGYDGRTLRRWWCCSREEGLLAQSKQRGAKERITASARTALMAAMKQRQIATMEAARQMLQTQFGVVYRSVSSLSRWCQRHGIKRKTGQPVHVKTDWDSQAILKKLRHAPDLPCQRRASLALALLRLNRRRGTVSVCICPR